MQHQPLDVVAIGNAIVDVLAPADDDLLERYDLVKGIMRLCDEEFAHRLYGSMGPATERSGGSAANTMTGVASFGGRAAFIGKVRDDQLGEVFGHDIRAAGVAFTNTPAADGPSTARCLILVTSDAQRTMNTFLGASVGLTPDDVDEELVAAATYSYLEGYLWDERTAKDAMLHVAEVSHRAGRKVSLTLSDPFCVDRHRAEFLSLLEGHVDVLFANEAEVVSLFEVDDFDQALHRVRERCEVAFLTRGVRGSVVATADDVHLVDAYPVPRLVDTTGAGDLYAAGALYGLTHGCDLDACGRLGSLAAAEVISHMGARPERRLSGLAADAGLIGSAAQ
ncbi:MAG TPA: adenosine kinase [Acidimicrobiales bacterium]|nr:adenosine kinase [Acidimicrobiales bacterium]